MREIIAGQNRE